jgi:hypothetical protein
LRRQWRRGDARVRPMECRASPPGRHPAGRARTPVTPQTSFVSQRLDGIQIRRS